ncbi:NGG1p interacting factor NIF3 [Sulfurovum sp. zt1-1]|uniref:NGG1p interacting factor NIF3 n=1 Tax=Sulfurovum zhangzhouensis TaxID=3019067 RepID=A0ABT7QXM7_9BACT|nr:NGG1p interacting factor NIF3 [Sulfurovum zhangzhouensis]MDM5271572.1 NGG1p interacting factor NIF3 [Sulfurovum zhangzhouensis]
MYKLNFYVPVKEKEAVKYALFNIGVGKFENYEHCSFEALGMGQFKPINNADPYIGTIGEVERVEEYKVEMICQDDLITLAIQTLKKAHPYEEVAYEVFKMEDF